MRIYCIGGIISLMSFFFNFAVFEEVAKNAMRGIWARRSKLNLVGAHINVFTGEWTQKVMSAFSLRVM